MLPAFVLCGRLDVVDTIGGVIDAVVNGPGGVRPAAGVGEVPYTTARGWVRRFGARAPEWTAGFAALTVELGGEPVASLGTGAAGAVAAIAGAFTAACDRAGWAVLGRWRFASAVSGGKLLWTNRDSLYLVVGKGRFMPPVPAGGTRTEGSDGQGPC